MSRNYSEEQEEVLESRASVKKKKKGKNIFKGFVLGLEIFVILGLVAAITLLIMPNAKAKLIKSPIGRWLIEYIIDRDAFEDNVHDSEFNKEDVNVNPGLNTSVMDEYTTLALFGIDARGSEFDKVAHSDSMIIVTINNKSGEVKMVSVYRDTYMRIVRANGSVVYDKLTNAYFIGGAEVAINTLNTNLDLNISDYAIINFSGLADVIDLLGGIEVNLTRAERNYINGYLVETRKITGKDAPDVQDYGDNIHLTGLQAVAYCRIRYTSFYDENGNAINNDYGRTARQRSVINKLVDKAKSAGADKLLDIVDIIFSGQSEEKTFATSLSYDTIMDMIPTLLEFSMVSAEGKGGFPYTHSTGMVNDASVVFVGGLSYNVTKLHQWLYNDDDYKPTQAVLNISSTLEKLTGQGEKLMNEDKQNP